MSTAPFPLFPVPRSFTATPGAGPGPDPAVVVTIDESLPAQGYRLSSGPDGVRVAHADARGLKYAQQTLAQLRSAREFATTSVEVADHPDFAVRGFMLDISRDRVPTRRTLVRLVDLLDLARINTLELYTEHTFAYAGHDVVWDQASPLTVADVRWLDDLCASRGIDLVPNQNTLGHMERWLKHEPYAQRAESPEGFDLWDEHRAPTTLTPTDENAAFANELVAELVEPFRARRVNIGADEPWELGRGASADDVAARGRGVVYFDYVRQLLERWTGSGYQVEFWADVFGEHPELMGTVPSGAVPVVWQYDGPAITRDVVAHATPELRAQWAEIELDVDALVDGFRARARVLCDAGENFWVAPGTSTWQSFTGRLDNALDNLVDAAEVGLEFRADGFLNTSWGDHGHYDPPSVAFPPLLFGGAVSWSLATNRDLDLVEVVNRHVVLDPSGLTGQVLVDVGRAAAALGRGTLNTSQLWSVLQRNGKLAPGSWPTPEGIEAADALLARALDDLDAADPACVDGDVVLAEVRQATRFARFGAAVLRLGPDGLDAVDPATARALLTRLDGLFAEHRRTWLLRSRPGGLDDSVGRLGALHRRLVAAAAAPAKNG